MENKIKENTKLEIPLIAAVLVITSVVLAAAFTAPIAPIALIATPASTKTAIPALLN